MPSNARLLSPGQSFVRSPGVAFATTEERLTFDGNVSIRRTTLGEQALHPGCQVFGFGSFGRASELTEFRFPTGGALESEAIGRWVIRGAVSGATWIPETDTGLAFVCVREVGGINVRVWTEGVPVDIGLDRLIYPQIAMFEYTNSSFPSVGPHVLTAIKYFTNTTSHPTATHDASAFFPLEPVTLEAPA